MSEIKTKRISLGDSITASENVVVEVPLPQDGSFSIKRGDGTDVMTVGTDNRPDFAQGFKSQGQGISPFGRKNVVINGDCRIVQDVASKAFPNNTSGYGGPDMFKANNSTAGGQFTQSQGTLTFNGVDKNTVRQTVGTPVVDLAATNNWRGINQELEGFNVYHLQGRKIGVSFIFNSNVSGVYSVSLRCFGGVTAYYLTSFEYTAGSPKKVEINTPEMPAGVISNLNTSQLILHIGFLNSGAFNSATTEQWVTGSVTGITVPNFTNWGATAGNFIELTELQLEPNGVSSFETLSFGEQLALCKRYFETGYANGVAPGASSGNGGIVWSGSSNGSGAVFGSTLFSQEKRAIPSISFYTRSGTLGSWQYERSGVTSTITVGLDATNQKMFTFVTGNIGANFVPALVYGHWVSDARL